MLLYDVLLQQFEAGPLFREIQNSVGELGESSDLSQEPTCSSNSRLAVFKSMSVQLI